VVRALPATSSERVAEAFARISEVSRPEVWIHLRSAADVLADAAAVDARVAAGDDLPLAGQVFAVKDNIDVAGLPTTAACAPFEYVPSTSATAVSRILAAGAVVIGKTNLDQFATGLVGTRSPFGAVRNSELPERVSGGSSSGSAVAVALGIVDFALGTDTAGSGRVPAAFNALVGLKPTIGLVPTEGVVPACRSYDCVTVFAKDIETALPALQLMTGVSNTDHRSRPWPDRMRLAAPEAPVIAIAADADLALLSDDARAAYAAAIARFEAAGAMTKVVDLEPFLSCAKLLYDGALVAERYEAFGAFLEQHADAADPSVLSVIRRAKSVVGADVIRDQDRVLQYRLEAARALDGCDALVLPTTTEHPTLAQVAADPIRVNGRLGTYTNFVNLLDMAAVSVPAGEADGGPFGISVIVRAFEDQVAIDIAAMIRDTVAISSADPGPYPADGIPVALFGAHMRGLSLNHQLVTLGARYSADIATAPRYRMHAIPGAIERPGVTEAAIHGADGASLAGELWLLSAGALGTFAASLAQPMTLGPVELADGTYVTGFGCSLPTGEDVTDFGGWRAYLDAKTSVSAP
jgi:allophanate hydrolase